MKLRLSLFFILTTICLNGFSQKRDTIIINGNNVKTSNLIPGEHRYLVYFKMGKDSSRTRFQFWTRKIDYIIYQGREAISITQEWENNDTVFHKVYSVCERYTLAPLYQESYFRGEPIRIHDFIKMEAKVGNRLLSTDDTSRRNKRNYEGFRSALNQYFLNWHLDLEVFSTLPYKENTTFLINFYDPGFTPPEKMHYTVIGSGLLKTSTGKDIDCWLLEEKQTEKKASSVFWINKKTKEVIKLEEEFSGKFRYKIKLPII